MHSAECFQATGVEAWSPLFTIRISLTARECFTLNHMISFLSPVYLGRSVVLSRTHKHETSAVKAGMAACLLHI